MAFTADKVRQGVQQASTGGYDIDNSLRFNDDDSAYLSRSPTTAGNQKTWTWSGWVKRGNLGGTNQLFAARSGSSYTLLYFSSDKLLLLNNVTGGFTASQMFRDTSSWYHIVLAVDTTQSTAADRLNLYVNGELITEFSSIVYPTWNSSLSVNSQILHYHGQQLNIQYFDGYLSEVNFIDGYPDGVTQSNWASTNIANGFGEFDATYGHWKPKAYTGSYGTNGFYLDFEASGTGTTGAGKDVSGEGNHWSTSGITADDQMLDSPTNNFATLNAIHPTSTSLAEGNLKANKQDYMFQQGTMGMSSGKWYWEWEVVDGVMCPYAGIMDGSRNSITNFVTEVSLVGHNAGAHNNFNSTSFVTSVVPTITGGDILSIALDLDASQPTAKYYLNDSLVHTDSTLPTDGRELYPMVYSTVNSGNWSPVVFNFGQDSSFAGNKTPNGETDSNSIGDFFYEPPTDFLALCTKNLPDVATGLWSGGDNQAFNTVTYTGDGTTSHEISGVGFQPDFTWYKHRNHPTAHSHNLFDSIRGATKALYTNTTDLEETITNSLLSFDSDGFTLGSTAAANANNINYVAWNWKAGGTAVSNTDGTITSSVSANPDAGFSIVSYTAPSSYPNSTETYGHGLLSTPQLVITKSRDATTNWATTANDGSTNYGMYLNLTNASAYTNPPSATTVTISAWADIGAVDDDYIAYCFHSVDGYSKVGSYTGNGSSDGTFVHTGFKPAYIMWKRTDSTDNWTIMDKERINQGGYVGNMFLEADSSGQELPTNSADTNFKVDFLSNGFKQRNSFAQNNTTNGKYIYIAFAEHPFKYSTAK